MSAAEQQGWQAKFLPKALLGYVMEARLAAALRPSARVVMTSPWDVWWVCYRAAVPLESLDVAIEVPPRSCATCSREAAALASESPPRHPDLGGIPACACLLEWAMRMREPADPAPPTGWPSTSVTLALLKPGAPWTRIRDRLARSHELLRFVDRTLTTDDTRRLYPEAYGADYVAARDAYLTSGPVEVLVIRARGPAAEPTWRVKNRIRRELGAGMLRNYLHMPDNPGDALADIAHLAGEQTLADMYERYERDRAAQRMAFYRAALGIGPADTDRGFLCTG